MDKKLVVTKERLPQRCEICHQSDMFVAATSECERCKGIVKEPIQNNFPNEKGSNVEAIACLCLLCGTLSFSKAFDDPDYAILSFISFCAFLGLVIWMYIGSHIKRFITRK